MPANTGTFPLWAILMACIYLCKSEEVPCKVTVEDGRASYSVPDFTGHDCVFSWSAGLVIANDAAKNDSLVLSSNVTLLQTFTCHDVVNYSRDCINEGELKGATCFANCSGTGTRAGGAPETHSWIAFVVIPLILIVFLIVGILYCIYFCRLGRLIYDDVSQKSEESDADENLQQV